MRNLLVFTLLAPVLVASVAIPSDVEWIKEKLDRETVETQAAPVNVEVTHAIDSVDHVPNADLEFSTPSSQAPTLRVVSVASKVSDLPLLGNEDVYEQTLEEDFAELVYLQALLKELKYSIREKEQTITQRIEQDGPAIAKCDSLKCVAEAIGGKVREAARKVFGTVVDSIEQKESLDSPRLHWPDKHTCGPPRHGKFNHTRPLPPPSHGNENHTRPPPYFKRPHLSFCHYPPAHHKIPSENTTLQSKPAQHEKLPKVVSENEASHAPAWRKTSQGIFQSSEDGVQAVQDINTNHVSFEGHNSPIRISYAMQALGLGLIIFVLTLVLKSIQQRLSTPAQKIARQMRRAERQHRSYVRRAAHREAIHQFLARLGRLGRRVLSQEDEEKQAAIADDDANSTTMTEDIAGLMNAADMVSEIVAAEEGRARRSMYVEDEGERLPAYDDRDDSELGGVADGLRYVPDISVYTPSPAGGASDILGVDEKQ